MARWAVNAVDLMKRVAGAGLSGAKEAPGFRAGVLQPRPPIKPLLTKHERLRLKSIGFGTWRRMNTEVPRRPLHCDVSFIPA